MQDFQISGHEKNFNSFFYVTEQYKISFLYFIIAYIWSQSQTQYDMSYPNVLADKSHLLQS